MSISHANKISKTLVFLAFVLPAFLLYACFFLIPLGGTILYSFTDWSGIGKAVNFVGLKNYEKVFFRDPRFLSTLGNTFRFAILNVVLINVIALGFALILDMNIKGKNMYRSAIFMPNAISLIIVSFIWQFMFTKVYSGMIEKTGLTGLDVSWFGTGNMALFAVVIALIWQSVGYYMVIFIAGLQTIDSSLLESVDIDGASGFAKFRYITIHLIMPSITVCLFLTIASSFKIFELFFQMTGGGPGFSTEVVSLNIYNEAFGKNRVGYGSAKAVVLTLIVLAFTTLQLRAMKKKEVEL